VLAFVDATIVNVAFPDIRRDFDDASLAGIFWVLNAYNIVFAAFIVAAGRIADLLGRKRFRRRRNGTHGEARLPGFTEALTRALLRAAWIRPRRRAGTPTL